LAVIVLSRDEPIRFAGLSAIEGISRRVRALTLRHLERDGLLVRTVHPTALPCAREHDRYHSNAWCIRQCHVFRKANRSALMVSACVVGMPCGKPL
jgi:hypothetical protein